MKEGKVITSLRQALQLWKYGVWKVLGSEGMGEDVSSIPSVTWCSTYTVFPGLLFICGLTSDNPAPSFF